MITSRQHRLTRLWLLVSCAFAALCIYSLRTTFSHRFFHHLSQDRVAAVSSPIIRPGYSLYTNQPQPCAKRYGLSYLNNLQRTPIDYCDSPSAFTCFHSRIEARSIDSFCFASEGVFDRSTGHVRVSCHQKALSSDHVALGMPTISQLGKYWYSTGPGEVMRVVDLTDEQMNNSISQQGTKAQPTTKNYSILVKREGPYNLWHSLMEIFSMTLTIDALRNIIDPASHQPYLTEADEDHTRVVVIDQSPEGPYFDLWGLLAKRKTVLSMTPSEEETEAIIIPMAGATNPIWLGDWEAHGCTDSILVQVFSNRILDFYGVQSTQPKSGPVVVLFIDRTESRRLLRQQEHLAQLQAQFPDVRVTSLDFATLPFREQIRRVTEADVLVGVHGAGLTHCMFLKRDSAVVEILPPKVHYKGFRNLAGLLNHNYFTGHAEESSELQGDWHVSDVNIDSAKFLDLVGLAIKTMYNKGLREKDAI